MKAFLYATMACLFVTHVPLVAAQASAKNEKSRAFAGAPLALGNDSGPIPKANVTAIPPFTGAQSETWEEFPVEKFGSADVSVLGGTATVSGTELETAVFPMFRLCTIYALPTDGITLMGANQFGSSMTITFSEPISAFGAYWGNYPARCTGQDDFFTFLDAAGSEVGTAVVPAGNGGMYWHGYAFATPVKSIHVIGDYLVTDGWQATVTLANSIANISTRTLVQTGDGVLIGGFIITGRTKTVLLRGLGPSLGNAGVAQPLGNPTLELHAGSTVIASNDNWRDTQAAAIVATGLPPPNNLESAIAIALAPGAYTTVLAGKSGGTGVGLVEIYDLTPAPHSHLANISTRGSVQTGDNVLIGGFILTDTTRVLVRALGPSLANAAVSDPLPDPFLELHGVDGTLLATNDDWQETQPAEIAATGIPPPDPRESAILQALPAGNYTAIVRGEDGTVGNALVEVYAQ